MCHRFDSCSRHFFCSKARYILCLIYKARWLSWLERRPVTAEVMGSSPIRVVLLQNIVEVQLIKYGILAQLGEHLPYKQRVTGSSPVGPTL